MLQNIFPLVITKQGEKNKKKAPLEFLHIYHFIPPQIVYYWNFYWKIFLFKKFQYQIFAAAITCR